MKYLHIIAILTFFNTCTAQQKQNESKMEKFNISEFDSHKVGGEYRKILDDGTLVIQFGDSAGYFEKIIPSKGWFYTYLEYYGNGMLKQKGSCFRNGDYKSGTWTEYDVAGKKLSETNFDNSFKLSLNDVLEIMKQKQIPFSVDNKFNVIKRGVVNSKPIWIVEWKVMENRIERIEIDDSLGKIVKQDYYKVQEDN